MTNIERIIMAEGTQGSGPEEGAAGQPSTKPITIVGQGIEVPAQPAAAHQPTRIERIKAGWREVKREFFPPQPAPQAARPPEQPPSQPAAEQPSQPAVPEIPPPAPPVPPGGEGPPPGQPPEVPRAPEPTIIGFPDDENRKAEVAALVEKAENDAEQLGVGYWMSHLQELHNLSAEERKARKTEYNEACQRLHDFAHSEKLFKNSTEVTILEEQMTNFEKEEIEAGGRTEEEKEVLQDLLDDLNKQENELIRLENSLRLRVEAPDLFAKKEWEEMQSRADKIQTDPNVGISSLRAEIQTRTAPDFLSKRDALKVDIDAAKKKVEENQDNAKQQELEKQRGEVDPWVKQREAELLRDEKPILRELPKDLPSFSEVLAYFNEEQRLKDTGDSNFWPEGYNRAKEALSWYLHEAKEKGALNDGLEHTLNQKYQEWAADLMSHRQVNPYDGSVRVIQKTFPQVQDEIIEYFSSLLDPAKASYVEHNSHWNFLRRHGVSATDATRLQGVREELVRRAQIQMEDSLHNLDQQLRGQLFSFTPLEDRLSGEWNVHRLEREVREARENQEAQERSRPLFRHESYYSIDLLGTNRAEVELGADQAADYIIGSATTFSLEVVRQRMELLTQGLERKIGTVEASEKISRNDATDIIHEIQRMVTNKLDFFILNWTSANLLMDQFAGYYSDRMRMDGDQKIKRIPAMNDGQAGLAIHWLSSSLYELYHRPQGFQGQLYDDDQTHKTMRDLMKEQIIKKLMKYELKKDDKNRSKLISVPTIHDYLQLFERKGIIPAGIIPEDKILPNARGEKNPMEFFEGLTPEKRLQLFTVLTVEQRAQLFSLFDQLTPDERVDIRQWEYNQVLQEVQAKYKEKTLTLIDLARVREAAIRLAEEKHYYQTIRNRAESAFDTADKVMNIFGEAADLGAPSIVMGNGSAVMNDDFARESSGFTKVTEKRLRNLIEKKTSTPLLLSNKEKEDLNSLQQVKANYEKLIIRRGDFININDYKIVQKYAILEAGKGLITVTDRSGKQYRVDDNQAMIRYRSKEWIKRWKASGLDRSKTPGEFDITITLPDGTAAKIKVKLAAGFEETGLTEQEWQAFEQTDQQFKQKGFQMDVGGVKFADIVKMDELQPVLNNFLVDYKSSESEINDPNVIEKAARGMMMPIANIRKRLGFSRRQRLEGTTQQQIDEYTQRIEDSRSLDAELERLAYFAATHDINQQPMMTERGKPVYKFSADRIDYGYQRQSWGVKRLHHLKAFWYTNLRRTVPRAADLVHAMPFSLTSLRKELAFDTFLQMCWEVGRMESIDNPALVAMGSRYQAMGVIRGGGEGSISDKEWKKLWGFLEKPLVDANSLWTLMQILQNKDTKESVESILKGRSTIDWDIRERIINHLQETTFSRFLPILVATEKSLGEDRQALSAGSGYEENDKFALRFLEWLMSNKQGDGREQGGLQVQKEIVDIIKLIVTPNSYRDGASLWDEFWRKQTPSHNPRLTNKIPLPTITAV